MYMADQLLCAAEKDLARVSCLIRRQWSKPRLIHHELGALTADSLAHYRVERLFRRCRRRESRLSASERLRRLRTSCLGGKPKRYRPVSWVFHLVIV